MSAKFIYIQECSSDCGNCRQINMTVDTSAYISMGVQAYRRTNLFGHPVTADEDYTYVAVQRPTNEYALFSVGEFLLSYDTNEDPPRELNHFERQQLLAHNW